MQDCFLKRKEPMEKGFENDDGNTNTHRNDAFEMEKYKIPWGNGIERGDTEKNDGTRDVLNRFLRRPMMSEYCMFQYTYCPTIVRYRAMHKRVVTERTVSTPNTECIVTELFQKCRRSMTS